MIKRIAPLLFLTMACATTQSNKEDLVETSARRFFEMFAARNDWQGFQALYAEDMVFEDMIYRLTYDKEGWIGFYNWPDTGFVKHPDYPHTLVLQELALTDSSAVGRGYFTPFYYQGQLMSFDHQWRFDMWLYFNKEGKITKHVDFIEYPPAYMKQLAETRMKEAH